MNISQPKRKLTVACHLTCTGAGCGLSETYCQLMIQSRVPQAVPDVSDLLAPLSATQGRGIAS